MKYERAGAGYAEQVLEWLANPHAYFRSFGDEARGFQRRHRSERLRTMTMVAPAAELSGFKPVRVCVDGSEDAVDSWESVFSLVVSRLGAANPLTFSVLQRDGELVWLGCAPNGAAFKAVLESGALRPEFSSWEEVVGRIQWLFLMCGIRLNEVIVQVDPYTDEQWKERAEELRVKRAEQKAFMEGRRAAQKAWAEEHPFEEIGFKEQ